jgi:hypothetical protein
MAKRLFSVPSFTPTATADNAALANATYMAVGAASTTQIVNILEIFEQGLGTDSTKVNNMMFARDLVLGATPTALAAPNGDGPVSGATAVLAAPPLTFVAAATGPSRTNTATTARLMLSFNCGGGVIRWKPADPSEAIQIIGTTVSISECSLSNSTAAGTTPGAMSASIMYEPL